jgi:signal transduction histidine kinase
MTAQQLTGMLSQIPFVLIFAVTLAQAIRRPRRTSIDTAVLFGAFTTVVIISWAADMLDYSGARAVTTSQVILIAALPHLLLRVAGDFVDVSENLERASGIGLAALSVAAIASGDALPGWLVIATALYFVVVVVYSAIAFVHGARHARGVTARRLHAAAAGSVVVGMVILTIAARLLIDDFPAMWSVILERMLTVISGICYFVAFSPPRLLRRAWQEPEIRSLLGRVAMLPRLPQTSMIVRELQEGAAAAVGAPHAAIGLWDAEQNLLRFARDGAIIDIIPGEWIAGRAFSKQQAIFSENTIHDDPVHGDTYLARHATTMLAAPITAGVRRLGVLTVFAPRLPIFADDDLQLVQLLADQAAVVLESRALIDEATRVQAREEATRLRDDFLVSAAHDLRTPLTAVITRAQIIERRARREPAAPTDLEGIRNIIGDLRRLNALISELLDAARVEHGRLVEAHANVDLVALIAEAGKRHDWSRHQLVLDTPQPVIGACDPVRVAQLIDNLIENAIKYSPNGGEVRIALRATENEARVTVSDKGVGIPPADTPHIFERFHRAGNVDTARFSGMGLGLYICRGIVEQHGGKIGVQSHLGEGTTFEVSLPLGTA